MYTIPNWKLVSHRVPGLNGYLKGNTVRSPFDIALSFGAEQTIDELAYLCQPGSVSVPAAEYQWPGLAIGVRCGGESGELDTAESGLEPIERPDS